MNELNDMLSNNFGQRKHDGHSGTISIPFTLQSIKWSIQDGVNLIGGHNQFNSQWDQSFVKVYTPS